MGRLTRFLRLERARPTDDVGPTPEPSASLRFRAIEPRRAEPTHDPFAPPPDPDLPLAIAIDQAPGPDDAKLARRDRAEAELADLAREREQLALLRQPVVAPTWMQHPGVQTLANLTTSGRVLAIGTAALLIGILAALTGPVAWGLFPIVAAVVIGSHFLHAT